MQIAIVGAGYTGGRGRPAAARHGRVEDARRSSCATATSSLSGFAQRGISQEFGEQLFQQIQGFGEYGFPESHAASFALLVYASAWLKVHHPARVRVRAPQLAADGLLLAHRASSATRKSTASRAPPRRRQEPLGLHDRTVDEPPSRQGAK